MLIEAVYPPGCIVVNIGGGIKRKIAECELHPLIYTFGFWGPGTKCWGRIFRWGTKHLLPRPKIGQD